MAVLICALLEGGLRMNFLSLLGIGNNPKPDAPVKKRVSLLTNLKDSPNYTNADRDLCAALKVATDTKHIPMLDADRWNAEAMKQANCYMFATAANPLANPHASLVQPFRPQPGELALVFTHRGSSALHNILKAHSEKRESSIRAVEDTDKRFQFYADMVASDVEGDGLIPLGQQFSCSAKGYPVALFLSYPDPVEFISMDYHFYALRQKSEGSLVWASKISGEKVTEFPAKKLFEGAGKKNYSDFIGYYERPYG